MGTDLKVRQQQHVASRQLLVQHLHVLLLLLSLVLLWIAALFASLMIVQQLLPLLAVHRNSGLLATGLCSPPLPLLLLAIP